jgi:hypothetical protein
MAHQEIPSPNEALMIEPLTPELVRQIGWLPQCEGLDREHCGRGAEFNIRGNTYCATHKMVIVERWEMVVGGLINRPAGAKDSDLELLELIRGEFTEQAAGYVHVIVGKVVEELSLPNTPEGRTLASWYLWEMGIFDIHQRSMTYEQS